MTTQEKATYTTTKPVLTTEGAMAVLQAAMAKANEIGVPMTIVVVDDAGTLKAFIRMDGANHGTVEWATEKAYTAAAFRYPTNMLTQAMEGNAVGMASMLKLPHMTLGPGGMPLQVGQSTVGGIGASGGTMPEQDQQVAEAGVAALHMS